jgi:WD40 repeat protein
MRPKGKHWLLRENSMAMSFNAEKNARWFFSFFAACALMFGRTNLNHGQVISTLDVGVRVNSLDFAPDGNSLVVAGGPFIGLLQEPRPGKLLIWDVKDPKPRTPLDGHSDGVSCAVVSPDGKLLATSGFDGSVRLWDYSTSKQLSKLEAEIGVVLSLAFSHDGSRLAASGWRGNQEDKDSEFAVWDLTTRKLITKVPAHGDAVQTVLFLRDNMTVATGSDDGTVKIWAINKVPALHTLTGHAGAVHCLALSPGGETLAVGSGDLFGLTNRNKPVGGVKLWNTKNWQEVKNASFPEVVFSVAYAPDGSTFVAAGTGGTIRVFNARDEAATIRSRDESLRAVCFSPDGKTIASGGSKGTVYLQRVAEEKESTK